MSILSVSPKVLCVILAALLAGCASQPDNPDPWEDMHRKVFAFNEVADKYVAKPVAKGYQAILPSFAETGVDNMFGNLHE